MLPFSVLFHLLKLWIFYLSETHFVLSSFWEGVIIFDATTLNKSQTTFSHMAYSSASEDGDCMFLQLVKTCPVNYTDSCLRKW